MSSETPIEKTSLPFSLCSYCYTALFSSSELLVLHAASAVHFNLTILIPRWKSPESVDYALFVKHSELYPNCVGSFLEAEEILYKYIGKGHGNVTHYKFYCPNQRQDQEHMLMCVYAHIGSILSAQTAKIIK